MSQGSSIRGRIVAILAGLALVVVTAFLAEFLVRERQLRKHGFISVSSLYTSDSLSGLKVPIRNISTGKIRINSDGFRSPEITNPKPENTIRLAFLGASTTFGGEVSNEKTWPYLVWRALEEAVPNVDFDYINAAVSGYSVMNSLRRLKHHVVPFEPDLIVIFHGYSDLSGNSYVLAKLQGLVSERPARENWLSRHSVLWMLAEKNIKVTFRQWQATRSSGKLKFQPQELSEQFRQDLREIAAVAQQTAGVVALATLTPRMRRDLAPDDLMKAAITALYYAPFLGIEGLIKGYDEYNRVIRLVAAETGAVLIGNETVIPPDELHYVDSVHFTEAGNQMMAKRVTQALMSSPSFMVLVAAKSNN